MRWTAFLLLLAATSGAAQDTISLSTLQREAVSRDPRGRQVELLEQRTQLRLRNLAVERLPQFGASSEASHQSEVPAIPVNIPGSVVPIPPKDRIEIAALADWSVYDGGSLRLRREMEGTLLLAARADLEAQLYPLRTEVTEAYFSALLLQERIAEMTALIGDLGARLIEVRTQFAEGAALPGDTAAIVAEMLIADAQRQELEAGMSAALAALELLSGRDLDGATLQIPDLRAEVESLRVPAVGDPIERLREHPQYAVFAAQRNRLELEAELISVRSRPQASAFARLAFGRPGYEQFTDDLHEYWIGGIRVSWTPWRWGSDRRERETLLVERQIVETQELAFSDRLAREVRAPLERIDRLPATIQADDRIIALREQLVRQARVQFDERAITAAVYVDAVTKLQQARTSKLIHMVELAQAQAAYLTILGVTLP